MDRYRITGHKADGSFGKVFTAVASSGEKVAVKILNRNAGSWPQCKQLREVVALAAMSHPNIIKLKEVIKERECINLIFELCEFTLYKEITSRSRSFRDDEVRLVMFQILSALTYIHSRGFMHRDVKPENVFCNGLEAVKIGDFGLAKSVDESASTEYISTRWYRAPELLLHVSKYGCACDMWAAGAVMAELYLLRPLFPGSSEHDQLFKICSVLGTPHPGSWPESSISAMKLPHMAATPLTSLIPQASPTAIELIGRLLTFNPETRITAANAITHAFFTVYSPIY